MGYNTTSGQQAQIDYGLAQAEAISSRSDTTFELGKQNIKERIILEDEIETIDKLARLAQQKAQDRAKKGGFGGLAGFGIGTLISLAIPGGTAALKAAKVLLPAIGRQAGKAVAGGFKDVEVGDLDKNVQDKLLLAKSKGRKIEDAYDDFEAAVDGLNDKQKDAAFMEFGMDAVMGLSMLKYDKIAVESGETLGELRELGKSGAIDYKFKDYLKDIVDINILGGTGTDTTMNMLSNLDAQAAATNTSNQLQGLLNFEQGKLGMPSIDTTASDAFAASQNADNLRRSNLLEQFKIGDASKAAGIEAVEVMGQRAPFDFSQVIDPSLVGQDTLRDISDAYEKISPEFKTQFPSQVNPERFAVDFLRGDIRGTQYSDEFYKLGGVAAGGVSQSEYAAKNVLPQLKEKLFNTPVEQLSPDARAYKLALDPEVNEALAKEIYETRGLGQFSSASKVEAAFRQDNPSFQGAFNRNTVSFEQIKPYIAQMESSNNPLAINLNNNGTLDFGLYQINSKFLNKTLKNFATSTIDGKPDVLYGDVQDILGSYGAVRNNPLFNLGSL